MIRHWLMRVVTWLIALKIWRLIVGRLLSWLAQIVDRLGRSCPVSTEMKEKKHRHLPQSPTNWCWKFCSCEGEGAGVSLASRC